MDTVSVMFEELKLGQKIWLNGTQYNILGLQEDYQKSGRQIRLNSYNGWQNFNNIKSQLSLTKPKPVGPTYIRFKNIPNCGCSTDPYTDILDDGVYAYEYIKDDYGYRIVVPRNTNRALASLLKVMKTGIPVFLVTGDPIGRGPDYQVVLADCEVVERITDWESFPDNKPEGRNLYR